MADMPTMHLDDTIFEVRCDQIEVTMLSRPDENWRFVDAAGHEHRWYVNGSPVREYSPTAKHELPTLKWIEDSPATEDYFASGHYECSQCGERISPGYKADDHRQFINGMKHCYINGELVSPEEFTRRSEEAQAAYLAKFPPRPA